MTHLEYCDDNRMHGWIAYRHYEDPHSWGWVFNNIFDAILYLHGFDDHKEERKFIAKKYNIYKNYGKEYI